MKPPKSRKNSDPAPRVDLIRAEAVRLGFDGCGISRAEPLHEDAVRLTNWLKKGLHAGMAYMERHLEKRVDPTLLVPGAKSVISVILNYYTPEKQKDADAPVISRYAYGKDYHKVVRNKLKKLLSFIDHTMGPVHGRAFTDSAPVLDRAWAAKSGLGWIGKNSNLISPTVGSFVFIGSLIIDLELDADQALWDMCSVCDICIRACPTSAIVEPRVIDSNKCISYQTIENRQGIDSGLKGKFKNRVFGCDICQDVCPWNKKADQHHTGALNPLPGLLEMTRKDWYSLDEAGFNERFTGSPVRRAKFEGLQRNLRFLK